MLNTLIYYLYLDPAGSLLSIPLRKQNAIQNKFLKDREIEAQDSSRNQKGIIQGVPLDISLEEILTLVNSENNFTAENAFRLKRLHTFVE